MAPTEVIYRRNAVRQTLQGQRRRLWRLWVQDDLPLQEAMPLETVARDRQLEVRRASRHELARLTGDRQHQGVAVEAAPFPYADIEEMLALAGRRAEAPFLLLLDLVQGPQNIGLLLRTAEACGVHGVIIQERRAPDITPHMVMASAGATEHLLIAQVGNLVQAMQRLRQAEVWLVGLDMASSATRLGELDLNLPLALVVGNEGSGLRRLVRQTCDMWLRLPMRGQVESLNAAVSASIVLYAAWQARGFAVG